MQGMPMQGSEGGLGWLALSYGTSCLGCLLGLSAMTRARSSESGVRMRWLLLAAVSIGGTGIWAMHFIAMLGFNLSGSPVTFNVPVTLASLIVAIAVVGVGLAIAVVGQGNIRSLLVGGTITGIGVAAMHYLGMSAVNMSASVTYNMLIVLASIVIAVTASIVALWFAMNVSGIPATVGAAMVMGVAVTGMHYTGMAAMKMFASTLGNREGMSADQLLTPLLGAIGVFTIVALFVAGLGPTERDIQQENEIRANIEKLEAMRQ